MVVSFLDGLEGEDDDDDGSRMVIKLASTALAMGAAAPRYGCPFAISITCITSENETDGRRIAARARCTAATTATSAAAAAVAAAEGTLLLLSSGGKNV